MIVVDRQLIVAYGASDEIETFTVNPTADATQIIMPSTQAFTNGTQTAFPTAINRRALFDDEPFLLGKDDPEYFRGRMPQEMAFASSSRRLYVANRLGESVAQFTLSNRGELQFDGFLDLRVLGAPAFPATLAEVGEDFYTSSRVSLNRDISCL